VGDFVEEAAGRGGGGAAEGGGGFGARKIEKSTWRDFLLKTAPQRKEHKKGYQRPGHRKGITS